MACIITIFANLPFGAKHTFAVSSNATLADFRRTLLKVVGQTPSGYKDSFRLHNHYGVEERDVLLDSSTANLVDAGISNESTITILRQGNSRTFLRVFIYASPPIWLIKSARLMTQNERRLGVRVAMVPTVQTSMLRVELRAAAI